LFFKFGGMKTVCVQWILTLACKYIVFQSDAENFGSLHHDACFHGASGPPVLGSRLLERRDDGFNSTRAANIRAEPEQPAMALQNIFPHVLDPEVPMDI